LIVRLFQTQFILTFSHKIHSGSSKVSRLLAGLCLLLLKEWGGASVWPAENSFEIILIFRPRLLSFRNSNTPAPPKTLMNTKKSNYASTQLRNALKNLQTF